MLGVQLLEDYLKTYEKYTGMVWVWIVKLSKHFILLLQASYLSSLGGNGTTGKVNKNLRYLMTDFLATEYNFAGQRNDKQAFGNTQLKTVIIRK